MKEGECVVGVVVEWDNGETTRLDASDRVALLSVFHLLERQWQITSVFDGWVKGADFNMLLKAQHIISEELSKRRKEDDIVYCVEGDESKTMSWGVHDGDV